MRGRNRCAVPVVTETIYRFYAVFWDLFCLILGARVNTQVKYRYKSPDCDEFLDEVKHAVCGFVQKRVLVPLEDHVHEALHTITDWDDELALKGKIKALQTKPQSFFGVPPHVVAGSGSDWEDARRELRRVNG
ncbi:uncharacterized protein KRP23_8732 [Phytophthora ramorum]|uniref:uncharacterized protein n=1 Tax=Phytophthora ramorum TaxID=164328 RepID=UPI00309A3FB6|nr:hypothetical protein KRP23_8732 [Phytophthora ramorum]